MFAAIDQAPIVNSQISKVSWSRQPRLMQALKASPCPRPCSGVRLPLLSARSWCAQGFPPTGFLTANKPCRARILMRVDGLIHGNPGDL